MGIYDRDYMRDDETSSHRPKEGHPFHPYLIATAYLVAMLLAFRLPVPIYLKILLAAGCLGASIHALIVSPWRRNGRRFKALGRKQEERRLYAEAARYYALAAERLPADTSLLLRLMVMYDCSGQIEKAEQLVEKMNGKVFPDSDRLELETFVGKYRDMELSKLSKGQRLRLRSQ